MIQSLINLNKDEAIKRVHHLRGVKYRNLKLYKVEMVEVE